MVRQPSELRTVNGLRTMVTALQAATDNLSSLHGCCRKERSFSSLQSLVKASPQVAFHDQMMRSSDPPQLWGDPERAVSLEASDPIVSVLFQVTGPSHVPWQDPVWQEVLHGYNVWVHVDAFASDVVLRRACQLSARHCATSSNLAALCVHATRMLSQWNAEEEERAAAAPSDAAADQVSAFSHRISLVGKARATAGALTLLRLLAHATLQSAGEPPRGRPSAAPSGRRRTGAAVAPTPTPTDPLREAFSYKSRDAVEGQWDAGGELMAALLRFLCHVQLLPDIPEIYDTVTAALQLLLVLLSPQLYQPFVSSFQRQQPPQQQPHYSFWNFLLSSDQESWNHRTVLAVLFDWILTRPKAPERSIQCYQEQLAKQVVQAVRGRTGDTLQPDGMYEGHAIVTACSAGLGAPKGEDQLESVHSTTSMTTAPPMTRQVSRRTSKSVILDATKGVLVLSSNLILLPFRLMSLAIMLLGHGRDPHGQYNAIQQQHMQVHRASRRTKDVLWLSNSPVADLATALLLLLVNNERASNNPFRTELKALSDNRWEVEGELLPDLPDGVLSSSMRGGDESLQNSFSEFNVSSGNLNEQNGGETVPLMRKPSVRKAEATTAGLMMNFEALFSAFGSTAHTEPGSLLLYTLLQASPAFAESMAVRSDLDTVVMPLLRTLYFSTSLRYYATHHDAYRSGTNSFGRRESTHSHGSSTTASTTPHSIRNCPFRSQSQLYVIVILLLLFSQDPSFGADAFRRSIVPAVPWYKERNLKDISLGSVLILSILRCFTFNLNRLHDAFLLSNCCAILMNLAPACVELHDYAAMRLAAVTVSSLKKYVVLAKEHPDNDEDDLSTPTSMHGEVSRTLLHVLKHCLSSKNLDKNLHLVYALVYHQADFRKVFATKDCPFKKSEIGRIQNVTAAAAKIIEQGGDVRTAPKALKILTDHVDELLQAVVERRKRAEPEDFTFTYEEEADPEIFFVPYVWEVIVCVITSSSIEWNKDRIGVFPLLDEEPIEDDFSTETPVSGNGLPQFARDVSDVV